MRYFYDTEFLEQGAGEPIIPISIGMISEKGEEFYAEYGVNREIEDKIRKHEFLKDNVVPWLGTVRCMGRATVAAELIKFWHKAGWPTELWAYFSAYDHVVLAQTFGTMLDMPKHVPQFSHDLVVLMRYWGVAKDELPAQKGVAHHALADARWVRDGWLYLNDEKTLKDYS